MSTRQLTFSSPVRYTAVAVFGFAVDFLLYSTLVAVFDASIYWANAAGFCVGAIINLLLIRKFVFPDNRFGLLADLPLTLMINGLMLGLGMILLWLLVDLLAVNPYAAKLLANAVTFIGNYIIRLVFFRSK